MFLSFLKKLAAPPKDATNKDLGRSGNFKKNLNEDLVDTRKDELKLDLKIIQERFDKTNADTDQLSGVLNAKKINARFADFKKKLDVWKDRLKVRDRIKRNFVKQSTSIRERLNKASTVEYTFDIEVLQEIERHYNDYKDALQSNFRMEKVINNFLVELPMTGHVIDMGDLERHILTRVRRFQEDLKIVSDFVQSIKTECVMDVKYFSFFEIPDLIVRKKYNREQYEKIKKFILKVKGNYLKLKQERINRAAESKEEGKFSSYDDDNVS